MQDNYFWIGQEQIPVDLSLLLTYSNDEDYWYAPGEYALRVYTVDTEVMGNMRDLNEFASADHSSLAEMRGACHAALENVYGSEFTDALESGYDLNAESHDCASGSAVLETCDTTRAEQPMNHAKGVR